MAISVSYSYKIDAKFVLNNKEEPILKEGISSIITNYDYDNNNIPIIYMGVKLETSLYNKMVNNSESGTITLTIKRSKNSNNFSTYKDYIKDRFTYTMSTNPDYNTTIEKQSETDNKIAQNYKEGFLALIQLNTTDNNKKIINNIIKDSNMASIIHKYTSHMNMVMEPIHNDKLFKFLIIPPLESIAKLLSYLNKQSVFYREGYRYFVDFDKTYLLSAEGNSVDSKDGTFSTIIINVSDPAKNEISHQTGIITDYENKAYIINVNANNTTIDIKKSEEKIFNKIMGVDSYGNTKEVNLDIPRSNGSSDKLRLERVPLDNMDYIDYLKDNIENTSIIFSITKTEVDSSLITPNKEYIVRNYPSFENYNGRYVLSYKKEVFLNQNNKFINSIIFGLRKIKNTDRE